MGTTDDGIGKAEFLVELIPVIGWAMGGQRAARERPQTEDGRKAKILAPGVEASKSRNGSEARSGLFNPGRRFECSQPTLAVDASHVYWTNGDTGTIGRANLDGTGVDRRLIAGAPVPGGVAVDALRSFSLGKVKENKRKGTAKLTVKVPGPGELELAKNKR